MELRGCGVRVLSTWGKRMEAVGLWNDQLVAESLGKPLHVFEQQKSKSEREMIAEAIGVEAALVTSGAAGGLVLERTGDIDMARWPEQTYQVRSQIRFPRMPRSCFSDAFSRSIPSNIAVRVVMLIGCRDIFFQRHRIQPHQPARRVRVLQIAAVLVFIGFNLLNNEPWAWLLTVSFLWFFYPPAISYEDEKLEEEVKRLRGMQEEVKRLKEEGKVRLRVTSLS